MTRALTYLRAKGLTDPWFLFFIAYMTGLTVAGIYINCNPEVLL